MATKAKTVKKTRKPRVLRAKTTVPPETDGRRIKKVGKKQYDLTDYDKVKSAEGNSSLDCGDELAQKLRGMDLDDVYAKAAKTLGESERALKGKYSHLNVGMQRMNLGNRLRAALANA